MMGYVGNNVADRVTVVDVRPLKSILKKPRDLSHVANKVGGVTKNVAVGITNNGHDVAAGLWLQMQATNQQVAGLTVLLIRVSCMVLQAILAGNKSIGCWTNSAANTGVVYGVTSNIGESNVSMPDENPIRTLGDYSKPSHEGYKNTIELPKGNNVVPLRSDTIRLVQNGCSFHGLWSENPNQHLKDFLKLVDSLDLDVANMERTRLHVPSTSDRHLVELENQVQHLIKAYLAPKQPIQVKKITSSCQICSGPHDTQYCMENPKQAFVEYVSSRTDEAGGKWYTFKPEQNNLGLVSNFMASQDARLSKFEANFKQKQSEMTNKIDIVLKAITERITEVLPSDTFDQRCHNISQAVERIPKQQAKIRRARRNDNLDNINTNPSSPPDSSVSFVTEKVRQLNSLFESLGLVPQSSETEFVCTEKDGSDVMFIEIIKKNDDSRKEEPEVDENTEA
ncbi:hypothetical protein Tco_0630883 [Tanacetum coccineum]